MIVGIDIGGANVKACDTYGKVYFRYNPLWIEKSVNRSLKNIENLFQPEYAGIVITGELSDAFNTKKEGIKRIADEAWKIFKNVYFFGIDGAFHKNASRFELFFSPNWLASARFLLESFSNAIFVDVGSTTTDIIPLVDGDVMAGKTDFERLKRGELIYVGALRTNLSFLLPVVDIDGEIPSSPEYFSSTGDALIVTGDLEEEDYSCDTPDGRGKKREDCLRRIARTVCCDLEELGVNNAVKIAFQAREKLLEVIERGIARISERYGIDTVIGGGMGEFLIKSATEILGLEFISLTREYGKEISKVFPAYATAKLLERHLGEDR